VGPQATDRAVVDRGRKDPEIVSPEDTRQVAVAQRLGARLEHASHDEEQLSCAPELGDGQPVDSDVCPF
jgi:hypothetical protein